MDWGINPNFKNFPNKINHLFSIQICYNGNCVNPSIVPGFLNLKNSSCDPNPCLNGGSCILNSSKTNFICSCDDGFTGLILKN
jgi:hypothetical protein